MRQLNNCLKCNYHWFSEITPKYCARCNNPNWNIEKQEPPTLANEVWIFIEDTQGKYKISNLGRIYSYKQNNILNTNNKIGIQLSITMISGRSKQRYFNIKSLIDKHFN